jgi:hypothetical protein
MNGVQAGVGDAGAGKRLVKWVLVVLLVLGAAGNLYVLLVSLGEPGQAAGYYAVNTAIYLVPAVLYAAAAALATTGRGRRRAWQLLLVCGAALSIVAFYSLATAGFGELMLAPFCLVGLSLLQLSRPRSHAAEAR